MLKKQQWIAIGAAALVAVILGAVVIVRMNGSGSGKSPPFLPGVYTCVLHNEFCRIPDTLVIRRLKMDKNRVSKADFYYEKIE